MVVKLKPYNPSASELVPDWHVVDADGEVLGRMATRVAWLLIGKHKPGYVPHLLCGDCVVVVNAAKVRLTGNKTEQKTYTRHTGYPGHVIKIPYLRMMERHPDRIVKNAVRGMLPRTKLGRRMLARLKVYAGPDHPHEAQLIGTAKRKEASGDA